MAISLGERSRWQADARRQSVRQRAASGHGTVMRGLAVAAILTRSLGLTNFGQLSLALAFVGIAGTAGPKASAGDRKQVVPASRRAT